MDFQFTPEDEDFRLEVRDFLRRELPPDWVGIVNNDMLAADEFDIEVRMRKALAKQGWLTLTWPRSTAARRPRPCARSSSPRRSPTRSRRAATARASAWWGRV